MNLDAYTVTDPYFGKPYIDRDEQRDTPQLHRNIHGGFEGTDTRFTFYFPAASAYQGRMFQPLEGAHAGHEEAFGGAMGEFIGGLSLIMRLGGYMIESNSGHIADDVDRRAGDDPTLYGHRASIEAARFSKFVAEQIYGAPPHHSYVWGGSGGGRRSPLCLEYGAGVYDGALPFMGGGEIAPHGTKDRIRGAQVMSFASMFNVQRILKEKLNDVIDAMAPGGSGDPYATLDTHQREELANLYRQGYPVGDEPMIAAPMGQMWLWTSISDLLQEEGPEYFEAFWTKPGYVGHDQPQAVDGDIIDVTLPVGRVIRGRDILEHPEQFTQPGTESVLRDIIFMGSLTQTLDAPVAVEIPGLPDGYRLGTGVKIMSGAAAGRQLYAMYAGGDIFACDGRREANVLRFTDVEPGDLVHVNNRAFLAFCYYYRHHVMNDPQFDFLHPAGRYIYPQHPVPLQSPLMGVAYSGQYEGKLLWVHHTHDSSLWPPQGLVYKAAVEGAQGAAGLAERFRLRWTENAEHITPIVLPAAPGRVATTWLIDYMPIIEQGLVDLISWVEDGISPADTEFTTHDGQVILPKDAATRRGIQPVVSVTANGDRRAETAAGTPVTLAVSAEMPPGAGMFTSVEWDFDGTGGYPVREQLDGTSTTLSTSTTHTYDQPGTYFATARVFAHRDGDTASPYRQVANLAQARIVVA
jgi:hypothetical protein